jgi:hypothetical protein
MVRQARRRRETTVAAATAGSSHEHVFSVADLDRLPEDAPVPAFVHRVSDDRRRQYVEELHLEPPSPVKRMRRAALAPAEEGTRTLFMDTPSFDGFTTDSERYELGFDDYDEPVHAAAAYSEAFGEDLF